MPKSKPYVWGRDKDPSNWHEACDAIKSLPKKGKPKPKEASSK